MVLVYLFLIVIILFTVHRFKLTAINCNGCFAQQACIAQELYVEFKHVLQRLCMRFTKVGYCMIVWLQLLQQPLQLNIAQAFLFQLAAAAYLIEITIEIEF